MDSRNCLKNYAPVHVKVYWCTLEAYRREFTCPSQTQGLKSYEDLIVKIAMIPSLDSSPLENMQSLPTRFWV